MTPPVCRLASASRVFNSGPARVTAVDRAEMAVSEEEVVGVVGPSGAGKSTLLSLLGALRLPTSGDSYFRERNLKELSSGERRILRLTKVGFVFQQFRLVPTLSVLENLKLPLALLGSPAGAQEEKAQKMVEAVRLTGKEARKPGELSAGEQQRVAVARALMNDPVLVLADEPTSQLDTPTGLAIVDLLRSLSRSLGAAVVISTHDHMIGESLQRVYSMRDGVLEK